MPDIVIHEEIGTHSYTPRLSHVQVTHDGNVTYKEPATYETSCSIDTAFFPFDSQVLKVYWLIDLNFNGIGFSLSLSSIISSVY